MLKYNNRTITTNKYKKKKKINENHTSVYNFSFKPINIKYILFK